MGCLATALSDTFVGNIISTVGEEGGGGGGGRELHASDAHTGSVSAVNLHAIFAPAV